MAKIVKHEHRVDKHGKVAVKAGRSKNLDSNNKYSLKVAWFRMGTRKAEHKRYRISSYCARNNIHSRTHGRRRGHVDAGRVATSSWSS